MSSITMKSRLLEKASTQQKRLGQVYRLCDGLSFAGRRLTNSPLPPISFHALCTIALRVGLFLATSPGFHQPLAAV